MQLAPAPQGFQWLYNRLDIPYTKQFDGIAEEFKPHEYRMMTAAAAEFLAERSIVKEDPFDPSATLFALVPEGSENFGIPLDSKELGIERLDRTHGDYVFKPSKDGVKTTAQVVNVSGLSGTKLPNLPRRAAPVA